MQGVDTGELQLESWKGGTPVRIALDTAVTPNLVTLALKLSCDGEKSRVTKARRPTGGVLQVQTR